MNNLIAASKRNDCLMAVFPYQNRGIWTSPFHTANQRNMNTYGDIGNQDISSIGNIGTDNFTFEYDFEVLSYFNDQHEFFNGGKYIGLFGSYIMYNKYVPNFGMFIYPWNDKNPPIGKHSVTIKRINLTDVIIIADGISYERTIPETTEYDFTANYRIIFDGYITKLKITNNTTNKILYERPYDEMYNCDYPKNILNSYGTLLFNDLDTTWDKITADWKLEITFDGKFVLGSYDNQAVLRTASMKGWNISWESNKLLIQYRNSDDSFIINTSYPINQYEFNNCRVQFGLLKNKVYIKLYENNTLVSNVEKDYTLTDFAIYRPSAHYSHFDGSIKDLRIIQISPYLYYKVPSSMFFERLQPKPYPMKQNGEYSTWEEQYGLLKYSNVKVENGCFKNNEKTGNSSANIKYLQTDFIKDLKQFTIICDFDFEIVEDNSYSSYVIGTPFILNGEVTSWNSGISIVNGNPGSINFECRVMSNQTQTSVSLKFEDIYPKIMNKYGGIYVGTIDLINKKMAVFKNGIKLKEQSLSNNITGFAMLNTGESNIYWLMNTNYYNLYSRGTLLFDSILSDEEIKRLSFKGEYINFNNNQKTWDDFVLKSSSINEHNFEFECIIKNTELVTDSWQTFFYHNGQGGTVNICYGENYQNIIYSYIKLKELDNNILYIGQPIVDIIQNNNIDILSKNAIHKWTFKKIGNNCQILINDIIVLNSSNDKYENALFYNDNIPITNFGNILSAKLKDLTTNTIVWQASQYDIMN